MHKRSILTSFLAVSLFFAKNLSNGQLRFPSASILKLTARNGLMSLPDPIFLCNYFYAILKKHRKSSLFRHLGIVQFILIRFYNSCFFDIPYTVIATSEIDCFLLLIQNTAVSVNKSFHLFMFFHSHSPQKSLPLYYMYICFAQ